jgi:hypothetical protein
MKPLTVNINDVLKKSGPIMTLRLTGEKSFRARLWISTRLILLAGWISNIKVERV